MNQHLQRAEQLLEQGCGDAAEVELRHGLAEDPRSGRGRALLALCLVDRQELESAVAEARRAVQLAPDEPLPHYALARGMFDRNRFAEAIDAVRESLTYEPANPEYLCLLGRSYWALNRRREALDAAEQGLASRPDHGGCLHLRELARTPRGADTIFRGFRDDEETLDPFDPLVQVQRGWCLLETGDFDQARGHFAEALRLRPDMPAARSGLTASLRTAPAPYRLLVWTANLMTALAPLGMAVVFGGWVIVYLAVSVLAARFPVARDYSTLVVLSVIAAGAVLSVAPAFFYLTLDLNWRGRRAVARHQRVLAWITMACVLVAAVVLGLAFTIEPRWLLLLAASCWIMTAHSLRAVAAVRTGVWQGLAAAATMVSLIVLALVSFVPLAIHQGLMTKPRDLEFLGLWGLIGVLVSVFIMAFGGRLLPLRPGH